MTEYWVSQGKHWCDLCKCWMNDTVTARANHEKGSGHKINVQRKLREMRLKEEKDKKEEARTKEELKKIDTAAERAYQKDLARQVCTIPGPFSALHCCCSHPATSCMVKHLYLAHQRSHPCWPACCRTVAHTVRPRCTTCLLAATSQGRSPPLAADARSCSKCTMRCRMQKHHQCHRQRTHPLSSALGPRVTRHNTGTTKSCNGITMTSLASTMEATQLHGRRHPASLMAHAMRKCTKRKVGPGMLRTALSGIVCIDVAA